MPDPHIFIFDLGGVICDIRDEAEWISDFMEPLVGEYAYDASKGSLFHDFETGKISQEAFLLQSGGRQAGRLQTSSSFTHGMSAY